MSPSATRNTAYGPPHADAAPGTAPSSALAIHTLTSAARDLVEGAIPPLWIRGEITDFKNHRNGHWYFGMRDAEAQIRCVVWSSAARQIKEQPENGMQVLALGQLTVWPGRGDLQFVVRRLQPDGEGAWAVELERIRKRLADDGLLDPARKRPLPPYPQRIAVITSPDGAAMHDIVRVTASRSPDVGIVVIPALVQGEGAVQSLRNALQLFERWRGADLVIVARGGGSREDLRAFDDETLARAVAACSVPVISAIGHETDITICDLVADVRAATPSAAAEIAVPSRTELAHRVTVLGKRLGNAAARRTFQGAAVVENAKLRLIRATSRITERRESEVAQLAGRLQALSPLATLSRGYSVARLPDGSTLTRASQFSPELGFELWLNDGVADAVARGVRPLPEGFHSEKEDPK